MAITYLSNVRFGHTLIYEWGEFRRIILVSFGHFVQAFVLAKFFFGRIALWHDEGGREDLYDGILGTFKLQFRAG